MRNLKHEIVDNPLSLEGNLKIRDLIARGYKTVSGIHVDHQTGKQFEVFEKEIMP